MYVYVTNEYLNIYIQTCVHTNMYTYDSDDNDDRNLTLITHHKALHAQLCGCLVHLPVIIIHPYPP